MGCLISPLNYTTMLFTGILLKPGFVCLVSRDKAPPPGLCLYTQHWHEILGAVPSYLLLLCLRPWASVQNGAMCHVGGTRSTATQDLAARRDKHWWHPVCLRAEECWYTGGQCNAASTALGGNSSKSGLGCRGQTEQQEKPRASFSTLPGGLGRNISDKQTKKQEPKWEGPCSCQHRTVHWTTSSTQGMLALWVSPACHNAMPWYLAL